MFICVFNTALLFIIGIPPPIQRLVYGGRELLDTQMLEQTGIYVCIQLFILGFLISLLYKICVCIYCEYAEIEIPFLL